MSDKYLRIIDRSYSQFLDSVGSKSIESYFNIDKYKITCHQNDIINYTIYIIYDCSPELFWLTSKLPKDILDYTQPFVKETVVIVSKLIFNTDYPFKPYKCVFDYGFKIKYNNQMNKICKTYLQFAKQIDFYNNQLIYSWLTSSLFEHHILCYITYILPLI